MRKYCLRRGRLLTEFGIYERDLLICGNRIEAIVKRGEPVSEDYEIIDCQNHYVSAGFVDIHQHGGGGSDYMDGDENTYLNATQAHLRHGITSVMPTMLSADKAGILRAVECYKKAKSDPRIKCNLLGLHMEGRYISPTYAGAQKAESIVPFDEAEYSEIIRAADGHLKRWSAAPELQGVERFAEVARENGIVLSIAHSEADFETVLRAYQMGFRHVTHLYSCTSTIVRKNGFRVPGIVEAAYYLDDMDVEIIADGCHLPHSLLAYVAKFKAHDRIALITDAMRAAGTDMKKSYLGSADDPLPVIIEDGVAKLEDRSAFGGSIATGDRLIRNMLQSGVSLFNAVKMITENPLRMMELDVKKGRLCAGYDADICVFDENINVKKVFCNGELVVDQPQ